MTERPYLAYYERMAARLRALLVRLDDQIEQGGKDLVEAYIGHNELGLALETIAWNVGELSTLAEDVQREMADLASTMKIEWPPEP
jgi:hypothetical protein